MSNSSSFALTCQRLPTIDAALLLAQVASWRSDDRWFSTADVASLYLALRLPDPPNLSAVLGRLRDTHERLRDNGQQGRGKRWTLTPEGDERAGALIADFDYSSIATELQASPGAFFADAEYPTLPPGLAPPAWAPGLRSFMERHPFDQNVFLMTRFPREEGEDPLEPVIERLRTSIAEHGLVLHIAADQQIVDDLWGNVGAHMWACRYGIGVLETRAPRPPGTEPDPQLETLNDNVLIELGSMLTIGRRCMILRDDEAPMPPTDLTSQIFKTVDIDDLDDVAEKTAAWIIDDLRLA